MYSWDDCVVVCSSFSSSIATVWCSTKETRDFSLWLKLPGLWWQTVPWGCRWWHSDPASGTSPSFPSALFSRASFQLFLFSLLSEILSLVKATSLYLELKRVLTQKKMGPSPNVFGDWAFLSCSIVVRQANEKTMSVLFQLACKT